MSVSERIKERREALRMTQETLADLLGYRNRSAITKIEKGTTGNLILYAKWEIA